MAYDKIIKANADIFEKIRFIEVSDSLILKPIMIDSIDNEAILYMVNSKGDGVKKYLPTVFVDNPKDAKNELLKNINNSLVKWSILYCIRNKKQQFPMGYINITSPLCPTGLNDWSVVFWLGEIAQGKGLMSASLSALLNYMASMEIETVKALVDKNNFSSIKVLERVGFTSLNFENGGQRILMSTDLKQRV